MATNDDELMSEVRNLTDYGQSVLTDSDLQGIVETAKAEINAEVPGTDITDFYSQSALERSLFWLTCFFAKVKAGEYSGADITVAEVEISQSMSSPQGGTDVWLDNFYRRLSQVEGKSRFAVGSASRTSDRSYGG